MVINLYDLKKDAGQQQDRACSPDEARDAALGMAGKSDVERARQFYEELLRAHLNTRGGSLAMLRSRSANRREIRQRIVDHLPQSVREARAALIYAYNSATVSKSPVSMQDLATYPPEHHAHEHDHDHEHELHAHDHDHDTPGAHYCRSMEQHILNELVPDQHQKRQEALHTAGIDERQHGRSPYDHHHEPN